jgi:hypothetical protein
MNQLVQRHSEFQRRRVGGRRIDDRHRIEHDVVCVLQRPARVDQLVEIAVLSRRDVQVVVVEIDEDLAALLLDNRLAWIRRIRDPLDRLRHDGQNLRCQIQFELNRGVLTVQVALPVLVPQRSPTRPEDIDAVLVVRQLAGKAVHYLVQRRLGTHADVSGDDHHVVGHHRVRIARIAQRQRGIRRCRRGDIHRLGLQRRAGVQDLSPDQVAGCCVGTDRVDKILGRRRIGRVHVQVDVDRATDHADARQSRTAEIALGDRQLDPVLLLPQADGRESNNCLTVCSEIAAHRRRLENTVRVAARDLNPADLAGIA